MAFKSNKGAISWLAKGVTVEVERAALIRLIFPGAVPHTSQTSRPDAEGRPAWPASAPCPIGSGSNGFSVSLQL
jgi:hypothetical protein